MKICIIVLVIIDIVFNYDASLPLLQDDFKTDVEYSFDGSVNFKEFYKGIMILKLEWRFNKEILL